MTRSCRFCPSFGIRCPFAGGLGLLTELHYNGCENFSFTDLRPAQGLVPFETPAPLTPFDEDLFIGARLAPNDTQDTQLLGGAVIDVDGGSMSLFFEAKRRIGQDGRVGRTVLHQR